MKNRPFTISSNICTESKTQSGGGLSSLTIGAASTNGIFRNVRKIFYLASIITSLFSILLCFESCDSVHDLSDDELNASVIKNYEVTDSTLHNKALKILRQNCFNCHGSKVNGDGGLSDIMNVDHLIDFGFIKIGDASESRILGSIVDQSMPVSYSLDREDEITISDWITTGLIHKTAQPSLPEDDSPRIATATSRTK